MELPLININSYFLIILIIIALFFDLTRKRIPNFLTFPAIIWGMVSFTVVDGFSGLWFSFSGLLVGLAIFFIPFAMGGMGGGDVKLLGAVGALQGWQFVLAVGILTAVVGGVMAIVYLIIQGRLLRVLKKAVGYVLTPFFSFLYIRTDVELFNGAVAFFSKSEPEKEEPARMPYGVAIATGVVIMMAVSVFPWGESYLSYFPWI